MFCRELVFAISLISLGSNHTFFLPHLITEAASLFCNFSELIFKEHQHSLLTGRNYKKGYAKSSTDGV
uniref:Uncharacterized protein n=1 Tax=Panstrongylus lignarius TaxID=156445 RepID=A0A224Y5G4_9HEMI